MNSQQDFSPLVRSLREKLGLTQEKFAARIGVTFPTINRWENGKVKPSPLAVRQIKDILQELGKGGVNLSKKYFGNE